MRKTARRIDLRAARYVPHAGLVPARLAALNIAALDIATLEPHQQRRLIVRPATAKAAP